MRHWKFHLPTPGALTVKLKVTCPPGGTDCVNCTRFNPQFMLSVGFCEPSLNTEPAGQVVFPVFRIVTETLYGSPAYIVVGTDCATYSALLVHDSTVIGMLGVASPNHWTPSC